MKKEIIIVGLVGILIGILFSPLFYGAGGSWGGRMMGGNRQGMMGDTSRHFIEQMIPHHDDAIAMAEIALTKGEHEEINRLAQDIMRTQNEENAKMREWYKSWYGTDVPDTASGMGRGMGGSMGMQGGMMGDETDTGALESAKPFDKEFIEQMIPHHQMAIMMAGMVQAGSDRPEIQQLAKEIIAAQTKEIENMRAWYRAWYANN